MFLIQGVLGGVHVMHAVGQGSKLKQQMKDSWFNREGILDAVLGSTARQPVTASSSCPPQSLQIRLLRGREGMKRNLHNVVIHGLSGPTHSILVMGGIEAVGNSFLELGRGSLHCTKRA